MDIDRARAVLLDALADQATRFGHIRTSPVLQEAALRLRGEGHEVDEHALLTAWYDLFRTGVISWGRSLSSPDPPLAHLTPLGRETLASLASDPSNSAGYLAALDAALPPGTTARDYLEEALGCYAGGRPRAAAVLLGIAWETLMHDLADRVAPPGNPPEGVPVAGPALREALHAAVTRHADTLPAALVQRWQVIWPLGQAMPAAPWVTPRVTARVTPWAHTSGALSPWTADLVRGCFLVFTELARLIADVCTAWPAAGPSTHPATM